MNEVVVPLGRRARTLEEMGALMVKMRFPGEDTAPAWRPRPTDIVITPFGKCGTTWLQQTFHTLRTRGDMDFDDISRVVPWIETAAMLGIDLEASQKAEPRGFKSHLAAEALPKGSKAIVSFRDPKDALVSMHRFMEGWFLEAGAVSLDAFAAARMSDQAQGRDYWTHLLSWWARRDDPGVLLLTYEAMSARPAAAIETVARFAGIRLDDDLLKLTLERTSLAFMLAHKHRFDDKLMREASETRCGLPPGGDSAKVRRGVVGSHRDEMASALADKLDAVWAERVAPATGFADYAAFAAAVDVLAA